MAILREYSEQSAGALSIGRQSTRRWSRALFCRFSLLMLCLIAMSPVRSAEVQQEHWVIGSFASRALAVTEGTRISGDTGAEVLLAVATVKGKTFYRLVVEPFQDEYDQDRLRDQLRYAGIADIWKTVLPASTTQALQLSTFDTLSRITETPSQSGQDFIVLGSYLSSRDANRYLKKIETPLAETLHLAGGLHEAALSISETQVNGQTYYRLLFGPVSLPDQQEGLMAARDAGVGKPWVLRGSTTQLTRLRSGQSPAVEKPSPDRKSLDRELPAKPTSLKPAHIPAQLAAPEKKGQTNDTNLARVKSGSSGFFLRRKN